MCPGTLGHIARYHSKTSNNNKSFIVALLHMSLSYLAYTPRYVLLLSIAPFSLFMIIVTWLSFIIVLCLDPFGFAYSDSEAWNEVEPSAEDLAYLGEQADQL